MGYKSQEELIEDLNDEIQSRTTYGMRQELAQGPGYLLSWSNHSARWGIGYPSFKRGETLEMDANVIQASWARLVDLKEVLGSLEPLPLYRGSFEYGR